MAHGGFFEVAIDKLPNNVNYDEGVYYDGKIVYTSMGIPPCDLLHDRSCVTTKGKFKWVWYWTPLSKTKFLNWFRFFVYFYKQGQLKSSSIFENGIFSYDLGKLSWTGFDIAKDILNLNPGRTDLYSVESQSQDGSDTVSFDKLDDLVPPREFNDSSVDSGNDSDDYSSAGTDDTPSPTPSAGDNSPEGSDVGEYIASGNSNYSGHDAREYFASDVDGYRGPYDYFIGISDENGNFHPADEYYSGNIRDESVIHFINEMINENISDGIQEAEKPTFDFSEWDE